MYLFVRSDLSAPQQIVQTAHAVDEIGMRYKSDGTNYMVLCGATNEEHLLTIAECLDKNEIDYEMFFEPDIGAHTAIATRPLRGTERAPLKKFRLKTA
jgi:hypothetical protein